MHIYNCHTHLFNLDCTPKNFLGGTTGTWFGKIGARLLQGVLAVPRGNKVVVGLANKFPFAKKYAAFLKIGTSLSPLAIFEQHLLPAYPAGTRFVVLAINFDWMGAGKAPLNQESQLWQLLEVRKRYPNTCLPFVSVDPRQGTPTENKEFVEKWIERGFVGIKLYPGLGFYPFDPGLDEVYEYAVKKNLPVMTHCSKGGIYYQGALTATFSHPTLPLRPPGTVANPGTPYTADFVVEQTGKDPLSNDTFCDSFLDPRAYELVLDRFPKLKICLAHYGGGEEIQTFLTYDKQAKTRKIEVADREGKAKLAKTNAAAKDAKVEEAGRRATETAEALAAIKTQKAEHILVAEDAAASELKKAKDARDAAASELKKAQKARDAAASELKKAEEARDAAASELKKAEEARDATWYVRVRKLLETIEYENVYTDVSYTLADKTLFETLGNDLLTTNASNPIQERVLFGTDFFMTTQEKPEPDLAVELMTNMLARPDGATAWQKLANDNPKRYLESAFYQPVP